MTSPRPDEVRVLIDRLHVASRYERDTRGIPETLMDEAAAALAALEAERARLAGVGPQLAQATYQLAKAEADRNSLAASLRQAERTLIDGRATAMTCEQKPSMVAVVVPSFLDKSAAVLLDIRRTLAEHGLEQL